MHTALLMQNVEISLQVLIKCFKQRRFFEIPRNIFLEPVAFTVDNGKLTANFKIARPLLNRYYKQAISSMYSDFNARERGAADQRRFDAVVTDVFGEEGKARMLAAGQYYVYIYLRVLSVVYTYLISIVVLCYFNIGYAFLGVWCVTARIVLFVCLFVF